jgi:hypothetical protein
MPYRNKSDKVAYDARYYAAHQEKIRALKVKYRAANPEEVRAATAKWKAEHPEKGRAYVAKWRAKHPEKVRAHQLRLRYGMTPGEYEALLIKQGGVCAICRQPSKGKALAIDHDHRTGKVRGLLCDLHNRGLGYFQDNPALLGAAKTYLE